VLKAAGLPHCSFSSTPITVALMPLPSFRFLRCLWLLSFSWVACTALAGEPVYQNDFEKSDIGKTPEGFTILAGNFAVQEDGGNKFLELPGSPLDSFGALFGPATQGDATASGRFFSTKQGRKYPAFGISLNGVSGYRLQVSAAKKTIEIFKGDEAKASAPFEWQSGTWTRLRIEAHKTDKGWAAQGKAWADGSPEPADWMIKFEDPEQSSPGRAGIWGNPFAGTAIRFDDLRLEKIP